MTTLKERARAFRNKASGFFFDIQTHATTTEVDALTALLTAVADEARAEERGRCVKVCREWASYLGKRAGESTTGRGLAVSMVASDLERGEDDAELAEARRG